MNTLRGVLILCCGLAWIPNAPAQDVSAEDRLRAALRDTTRKLHEAQDEVAALRAEVASLREQTTAAPQACPEMSAAARRQMEQLSANNAALRKYADEAQQMVAKWQEAQAKWQEGLQQATHAAQTNEAAARTLQEQLERTQQQAGAQFKDCVAKNGRLVELGSELLERYRDKGLWDLFGNAEPITGIKRVEFETLLQEYGGKLEDNQVNIPEKAVEHGS